MKLGRVFWLLAILGTSAVAAQAHTPIDSGSLISDPRVILNDPSCPTGAYCVDLLYIGPTLTVGPFPFHTPFVLSTPSPDPVPPIYTCGSNIFDVSLPTGTITSFRPLRGTFTGCDFWDGTITSGETVTLSAAGGPVQFTLPTGFSCPDGGCSDGIIDLSPEPAAALLYMTGLIFLAGLGRRKPLSFSLAKRAGFVR